MSADHQGGGDPRGIPTSAHLDVEHRVNSVATWVSSALSTHEGPLDGLRVGVKDNIEVGGVRSTCASLHFADRVAEQDAEVVRRLRAAGADVVATLNLAEFALGVTSQNSALGGTRNPWDLTRVPAGSSGGSGAAVAAGLVDVALGTDSGGSVRLPASACGVVGLRPTPGAIDMTGVFEVSRAFDTVGPMARTVEEVAQVFDVLSDLPRRAPTAVTRVGAPSHFVTDDIDPGVATVFAEFVRALGDLVPEVVDVEVPGAAQAQEHVYTLLYRDVSRVHADHLSRPELYQPATLERISLGAAVSEQQASNAARQRSRFREGMRALFDTVEVVVTPTLPVDVPPIDADETVLAQTVRLGQLSYPWSLHNGPTLTLPIGFHPVSGMPVGAQLTAAHGNEGALFWIGRAYQEVTTWHQRRPPVHVPGEAHGAAEALRG